MQLSLKTLWSNRNYRIATIIAIATLLWLTSGLIVSGNTPEPRKPKLDLDEVRAQKTEVRARYVNAQNFPLLVSVKGQTEANRYVELKAEVTGQVEALPAQKGAVVKEGEVICQLAKEDRELRLSEAQAALDQAQLEYDGALKLQTGGYQSKTAIATSKARLEMAKADVLRRKLDLQKTEIRAPFDALLDTRPVEVGNLMRPGDTCGTLLDMDPLIVSGQVSEQQITRIQLGDEAGARLVTGEVLTGKIRYVSHDSDDTTRTFRIEVAVENPEMEFFSGITADLNVKAAEIPAHHIPASLLTLGDEGELGVRILDEQKRVHFVEVNVVGDDQQGLWLTGLPTTALLITVGQEYVSNGEIVAVAMEKASGETPTSAAGEL